MRAISNVRDFFHKQGSRDRQYAVVKADCDSYPVEPPFHPDKHYPEYRYVDTCADNAVYAAIRQLLKQLRLDESNYGTDCWNPLGQLVNPGDIVVVKPNFVSESRSENVDAESITTHGSVIRPLLDYCLIALQGKGSLIVADAPQTDSNFEKIKESTKIQEVLSFINANSSVKVALLDLREGGILTRGGLIVSRFKLSGDPNGYTTIDLGQKSAFHPIEDRMHKAYGSDYNFDEVRRHHSGGKHEYRIANTVLTADAIINVPKLKTHKKAGITCSLKNAVGINGDKNYLPHFRFGSRAEGGDAYPKSGFYQTLQSSFYESLLHLLARLGPQTIRIMVIPRGIYALLSRLNVTEHTAGDWHGNDTIWRTIVDLNRILFCADKSGTLRDGPQRKFFSVIDGIVAGEGEGPFAVSRKQCGIVFGGFDPVAIDVVAANLMGFDYEKIPHIVESKRIFSPLFRLSGDEPQCRLRFRPPTGWEHIRKLP